MAWCATDLRLTHICDALIGATVYGGSLWVMLPVSNLVEQAVALEDSNAFRPLRSLLSPRCGLE